jgi:uncharacterized protein
MLKLRAEQTAQADAEAAAQKQSKGRQPDDIWASMAKSAARAAGSQAGRQIVRGVLGSIFGGRR